MLKWITGLTHKIEHLAVRTGFIYRLASRYYHRVVHDEIALAGITADDRILCIGGGMCPFSAILFHQKTGAGVTVIDHNESCVPNARQVISRLGIGDKVRVLHKDGLCAALCLSDYTVVHFALQVSPMAQVFAAVERQVPLGTRLLVRRPKAPLCPMYCTMCDTVLTDCPLVMHRGRNIGSTVLYTKQTAMPMHPPVAAVA